ncbi:MAG: DUF2911 domain-containing protein [Gemmatimonadales bacterium]
MLSRALRSIAVIIAIVPAALVAQERGVFVARLGADTVSLERFEFTRTALTGDLVVRTPRTQWFHYVATLRPDGLVGRVDLEQRPIGSPAGAPISEGSLVFGRDSVTSTMTAGGHTRSRSVAVGSLALPALSYSYAMMELGSRLLVQHKVDSLPVDLVYAGSVARSPNIFRRVGSDSASYDSFGSPVNFKIDRDGRALGFDAGQTTVRMQVARVPSLDFDGLAASFAVRDAAGQGLGVMSSRDTARGTIGSASVSVDYGRPMVRGRRIFGGLVPWGQVWRTGANAATQLTTDRDLIIGGAVVPAGTYTLWTLPTKDGATLIINSQTGQWGTDYDAKRDFARVPLAVSSLAAPVERFTLTVSDAVLVMDWDRSRFTVPIRVK